MRGKALGAGGTIDKIQQYAGNPDAPFGAFTHGGNRRSADYKAQGFTLQRWARLYGVSVNHAKRVLRIQRFQETHGIPIAQITIAGVCSVNDAHECVKWFTEPPAYAEALRLAQLRGVCVAPTERDGWTQWPAFNDGGEFMRSGEARYWAQVDRLFKMRLILCDFTLRRGLPQLSDADGDAKTEFTQRVCDMFDVGLGDALDMLTDDETAIAAIFARRREAMSEVMRRFDAWGYKYSATDGAFKRHVARGAVVSLERQGTLI